MIFTPNTTSGNNNLSYPYPEAENSFQFIKFPKFLLKDDRLKNLSLEAKFLYSSMLDKQAYAASKNQVDTEGRVYIDYSVEYTCELLQCSKTTAKKIRKELKDCFGEDNGLVRFVSRGQGKNDYVYVMNYHPVEDNSSREPHFEPSKEQLFSPSRESESAPYYNTNKETIFKDKIHNPSIIHTTTQEENEEEQKKSFLSKNIDKDSQNLSETKTPSITKQPTNVSEKSPINIIVSQKAYSEALNAIKNQIAFDQLLIDFPEKKNVLDLIIEIMARELISKDPGLTVNGYSYTRTTIQERLKMINAPIVRYVLDCLQKSTTKVINMRRYLLVTLLNAPAAFDAQNMLGSMHDKNCNVYNPATGSSLPSNPSRKKSYEPYIGRHYSEDEIRELELKKLGISV